MKALIFIALKKAVLAILLVTTTSSIFAQNGSKRPNIVFIMADDLGYGDLGAYGQVKIETKHIDSLASSGMKFDNFYAGTSVCAPSRSSLMTGQHTGHTYVRGNKEIEPEGQEPLADSVQTIAMLLQKAGYTTGAFGKWGLGMVGTTGAPDQKGFDEFYGYNCQRQSHRYYPTHLWHNTKRIELDGNGLMAQGEYAPALIQERTLAFIDANKDKPFFLYVPTVLPHAELAGPEDEYYKQYAQKFDEKPYRGNDYGSKATVPGYNSVEKPHAMYASMVSRMDAYVGQIVERLRRNNLLDNTIIIFTSDNGAHKEGGADPNFFNSSGGLRGTKRDLYEGGIKTPFIAYWPGKIAKGKTSNYLGAFWDIMPTLADLAKTDHPRYTDGISFVPTLLGYSKKQKQHDYLYWEFHEDGGRQAVRKGDWKLILQKVMSGSPTMELYNLKKDPKEQHNIAIDNPKKVMELRSLIEKAHVESSIFPLITKLQ
ncbi:MULTISPECIES: arylsulfatase [Sphingobacterium]|uniref:Arylsulfatase n=1 Tax=Sphingobacterium athyrii TaxID=2152717 RepID=A0A363NZX5_9SPHI|nr:MULTISPECIES: arylsulfatase [Sphingobacterium]PUV26375.1 arylsulfatase [Sphingobacterium athyrii]QIH32765.1 arylsulfatase [Sphingobacterium sp. DR205]